MTNTENYLKYKSSLIKFDTKNFGLSSLEINPTELCNRLCDFCPRSTYYPNKNLNLSVKDAKILKNRLDEFDYKGIITISGKGEPLLNKNIIDIVGVLNSYHVILITNGDIIIKDTSVVDKLFEKGLSKIVISEYDDMTKDWHGILKNYNYSVKDLTSKPDYFNNRGGSFDTLLQSMHQVCFFPFYKMVVDYDLSVQFCGNDWKYKETIGNLINTSIKDVWLSDKMNNIRKHLHKGERCAIQACKSCDVDGKKMGRENYNWFTTCYLTL